MLQYLCIVYQLMWLNGKKKAVKKQMTAFSH